jgi:drug/metabolite transporter (DMT)-like permease
MLTNEQLIKRFDAAMINYYQMLGIALCAGLLLPFYVYALTGQLFMPGLRDLVYLLVLASVCTIAIYVMVAESLRQISAFTVNLSFNLEPVYSIILAMIIFKENKELNLAFYAGLALILISVIVQMLLARKAGR